MSDIKSAQVQLMEKRNRLEELEAEGYQLQAHAVTVDRLVTISVPVQLESNLIERIQTQKCNGRLE